MTGEESYTKPRRLRIETVRGVPYQVAGRKLTPVARVLSYGLARGTIGAGRISGWGMGVSSVTPLAVVEETDGVEHSIPLTGGTATALKGTLAASLAVVLFFTAVRWWVRRCRSQRQSS